MPTSTDMCPTCGYACPAWTLYVLVTTPAERAESLRRRAQLAKSAGNR